MSCVHIHINVHVHNVLNDILLHIYIYITMLYDTIMHSRSPSCAKGIRDRGALPPRRGRGPQASRHSARAGEHLSNTTRLTHVFAKSGE